MTNTLNHAPTTESHAASTQNATVAEVSPSYEAPVQDVIGHAVAGLALRETVEPVALPLDTQEREALLENNWWKGTKVESTVENSLYEVFSATAEAGPGEEPLSLDILNCTPKELSPKDIEAVQTTLQKVSAFTKGKVFDRVSGIIFSGKDAFPDGSLGGFVPHGGYLRINLDEMRKEEGDVLAPRYEKYFKDNPDIGTFELNLAHEMGHAIDVRSNAEVEASGAASVKMWHPPTSGVSAFNTQIGWRHSVQDHAKGIFGKADYWNMDDATMSENNEYPPTAYAATHPGEDFAESFAIAALGGDTSTLSVRVDVIQNTIKAADARTMDPKSVMQFAKRSS